MRTLPAMIVGGVIAITIAFPVAAVGSDLVAAETGRLWAALGGIAGVTALLAVLIILSRHWIIRQAWGTVANSVQDVTAPLGEALDHANRGNRAAFVASANQSLHAAGALYSSFMMHKWVVGVLLSVLALFAGMLGAVLMYKQNTLITEQNKLVAIQARTAEVQTQIAKQQVSPHFILNARQIRNEDDGFAYHDRLLIDNIGAPVQELRSKFAIFVKVELYYTDPRKGRPINRSIALNGYYAATLVGGEGRGRVFTGVGDRNNERAVKMGREFIKLAKENERYGFLEFQRYVRLEYRNQLGEACTEYYFVPVVDGGQKVGEAEGEAKFSEWDRAISTGTVQEFGTLDAQKLLDLVSKPDK